VIRRGHPRFYSVHARWDRQHSIPYTQPHTKQ